jgi:GDPmannose 4,6-dehydratase
MTATKRALITGITGQDGSYLAEYLLGHGYEVIGMVRRSSTVNFERIAHIQNQITLEPGDLLDEGSMIAVISKYRPGEVYNLAAQSYVRASFTQPVFTGDVTALGVTRPRSDPCRRPGHPLLPGFIVGDVREGGRDPQTERTRCIRVRPTA